MLGFKRQHRNPAEKPYQEVLVHREMLLGAVVLVPLIIVFIMAGNRVEAIGIQKSDISGYVAMAAELDAMVEDIRSGMLREQTVMMAEVEAPEPETSELKGLLAKEKSAVPVKRTCPELSGIMWNERDPLVIIDREVYRNGDQVNGFTVHKIDEMHVVFKDDQGKEYTKFFYEGIR